MPNYDKKKFERFLQTLEESGCKFSLRKEFNEPLTELMMEMQNEELTKEYTMEKWDEIRNLSLEYEPLQMCILNAKNVPSTIEKQIVNSIPNKNKLIALRYENLSYEAMQYLIKDIGNKKIINYLLDEKVFKNNKQPFTQDALTITLQFDEICQKTKYKALSLLEKDNPIIKKMINDAIHDKKKFKAYGTTAITALINNKNIEDVLRDEMFASSVYNVEDIDVFSKKMSNELFDSAVDAVFDTEDPIDIKTGAVSEQIIEKTLRTEKVNSASVLNFLNQYLNLDIDVSSEPLEVIAEMYDDKDILKTIASSPKFSVDIYHYLKGKHRNLDEDIMTTVSGGSTIDKKRMFINTIFNNPLPDTFVLKMASSLDVNVCRSIIASYYTTRHICDNIISIHSGCGNKQAEELDMILYLREPMFNFLEKAKAQAMMNLFLDTLCDTVSETTTSDIYKQPPVRDLDFLSRAQTSTNRNSSIITKNDTIVLLPAIEKAKKEFPNYKDTLEEFENIINKRAKLSELFVKFSTVFSDRYKGDFERNVFINVDELYNILSTNKKDEFIDLLSKQEDISFFIHLRNEIIYDIVDVKWNTNPEQSIMYIYMFADVFNTTEERLNEFVAQKEEKLKEMVNNSITVEEIEK